MILEIVVHVEEKEKTKQTKKHQKVCCMGINKGNSNNKARTANKTKIYIIHIYIYGND